MFEKQKKEKMNSCFGNKNTTVTEKDIISILKPTGNYSLDKQRAEEYADAVKMDSANRKMAVVMATQGPAKAAKQMMEDCGGDYFVMRSKYG